MSLTDEERRTVQCLWNAKQPLSQSVESWNLSLITAIRRQKISSLCLIKTSTVMRSKMTTAWSSHRDSKRAHTRTEAWGWTLSPSQSLHTSHRSFCFCSFSKDENTGYCRSKTHTVKHTQTSVVQRHKDSRQQNKQQRPRWAEILELKQLYLGTHTHTSSYLQSDLNRTTHTLSYTPYTQSSTCSHTQKQTQGHRGT